VSSFLFEGQAEGFTRTLPPKPTRPSCTGRACWPACRTTTYKGPKIRGRTSPACRYAAWPIVI